MKLVVKTARLTGKERESIITMFKDNVHKRIDKTKHYVIQETKDPATFLALIHDTARERRIVKRVRFSVEM